MPNFISEDNIEKAALQKLQHLNGFDVLDCYSARPDDLNDGSGRRDKRDVILADRLNSGIPENIIDDVVNKVMDRCGAMLALAANREVYHLIRDGVPVEFEDAQGIKQYKRVRLIDFDHAAAVTGWKSLPKILFTTFLAGGIWARGCLLPWINSRQSPCTTRCRPIGKRRLNA